MPKKSESSAASATPRIGDVVEIEILPQPERVSEVGPPRAPLPVRVRHQLTGRVLKTGDRVVFSVYYRRRVLEGAIAVVPVLPSPAPASE